jgi:hypothetical protein
MTTPAQLSAQIVALMTRWNAQQDQLADWLAGDPAGGPNGDGKYPLTNAEGTTENFLCLPAVLNLVAGPASAAVAAKEAADLAAALAQAAQAAASAAASVVATQRADVSSMKDVVTSQRNDVAAKWSDVLFYRDQTAVYATNVATAETLVQGVFDDAVVLRDEATTARDETLVFRNAAQVARDQAQAAAASINPATLATKAEVSAQISAVIGAAPGQLDTLNELASALGNDPSFAATMTAQLAGKAPLSHTHTISQITGLQTALDGRALLSHTHTISSITGLQVALDAKLNTSGGSGIGNLSFQQGTGGGLRFGHTSEQDGNDGVIAAGRFASGLNIVGVQTSAGTGRQVRVYGSLIDAAGVSYVLQGHTHAISDVGGLQSALDAKLSLSGGVLTGLLVTRNSDAGILFGDDAYLSDRNIANTVVVEGGQNPDRGYIQFGTPGTLNQLGAIIGGPLTFNGGGVAAHASASYGSARITVSTASPTGGASGDIWLRVT